MIGRVLAALAVVLAVSAGARADPVPGRMSTVADLRSGREPYSAVTLLGYRRVGDGGEGLLTYVAGDTASPDNGCTIFVDAAGHRYRREFSGAIRLEQCGGSADGATDNLGAIDAAIAACAPRGNGTSQDGCAIALRNGIYCFSGTIRLTAHHGLSLVGSGMLATVVAACGGGADYPLIEDAGSFRAPTGKIAIRDLWVQCGGMDHANANGIELAYTNTGLVENVFFTGCNHAIDLTGVWQTRLLDNRMDGAGPARNKVCVFMNAPTQAADTEHNNTVVAAANVCQNPAEYGLRWLDAQGSLFIGNQWMLGKDGVYGCDPPAATFADGSPYRCEFVSFQGDQTDSTGAQGWLIRKGLAHALGYGVTLNSPWAGNSGTAGIDIEGADGVQVTGADVENADIAIKLVGDRAMRVSGRIFDYNRNDTGAAAVALDGTTASTIEVTTEGRHPVGYNGVVELQGATGNGLYGLGRAPCTMGLALGGAANAATGADLCWYEVDGLKVHVEYQFDFASLPGSGAAVLSGLPVAAGTGAANPVLCTQGCADWPATVYAETAPGSTTAALLAQTPARAVPLTNANFNASSATHTRLTGALDYFKN